MKITGNTVVLTPPLCLCGVTSDGKTVPGTHAKVDAVSEALDTPGFNGDSGEVLAAGRKHVLLGLGASDAEIGRAHV